MVAELPSTRTDEAAMRNAVLFDGPDRRQRLNRFWILLVLSALIASAGVAADSTATVIGAMIVAPMMLPIQGAMLSTVLGDRTNLLRSVALIVSGAAAAIAIGFLVGFCIPLDVVAASNTQVASRVSPGLLDLLAALATGVVGSIALARRDISDTLPGVAIAISLVPPLAVAGLTLEAGAYGQAVGALLLFTTNVAAILATGVVVMGVYRVTKPAVGPDGAPVRRRRAVVVIVVMLVIVGIPLTASSWTSTMAAVEENTISTVVTQWANGQGWESLGVTSTGGEYVIRLSGPMPVPETSELEAELRAAGVDTSTVTVEFVPSYSVQLD